MKLNEWQIIFDFFLDPYRFLYYKFTDVFLKWKANLFEDRFVHKITLLQP